MSQLQDVDTAVSVSYKVKIDGRDLGDFTSCEGLGVEVVLESREEGGNNGFVWQFPSRLKYSNVKLSRPLGKQTELLTNWIAELVTGYKRYTATIEAQTAKGTVVAKWSLNEVIPVRWTGPQMTPDQPKVLTETLEIAHHGFLPSG